MAVRSELLISSERTVWLGQKPTYEVSGLCSPNPFDTLGDAQIYCNREAGKLQGGHLPPFEPTNVIVHPKRRIDVRMIHGACYTANEWAQCTKAEWEYNARDGRLYFQGLRMGTRWSLKPYIRFRTAFQQSFVGVQGGWNGLTLISRIEPAALVASGSYIRLTVEASTMSTAHIDRIYVSQPDPTPGANPYDAANDLTKVWDDPLPNELIVSQSAELMVPEAAYNLDRRRPLLIAMEFSVNAPSGITYARNVPSTRASSYWAIGQEAAVRKRNLAYGNGIADQRYYFVGLVETGDVVPPHAVVSTGGPRITRAQSQAVRLPDGVPYRRGVS